jgi:antibiotic biosynthesis monooxygenase (ABM) superfamily enzyme
VLTLHVTLIEFFLNEEGRERFPAWSRRLGALVARYPGFIDVRPMRPVDEPDRTVFELLFDTAENAQRWVDSSDRRDLLAGITPYWTKPYQGQWFLAGTSWTPKA